MIADELPGGVDDVFLDFDEFAGLAAAGGTLTALGRPFADDLFEEPHLGKKHVARGAALVPVAINVFGPEIVGDEIALFGAESLDVDEGAEKMRFIARHGFVAERHLGLFASEGVAHPGGEDFDVVPDFGLEGEFLEGGDFEIATRKSELDLRRQVFVHVHGEPGRTLVAAVFVVDEVDAVALRLGWLVRGEHDGSVGGIGREGDDVAFLSKEFAGDDRFVHGESPGHLGSLHHGDLASVGDLDFFPTEVGGRGHGGVGFAEGGKFKGGDGEVGRLGGLVVDAVGAVGLDFRDEGGKDAVVEPGVHGKAGLTGGGGVDEEGGDGSASGEGGLNDEARAFFEFDIAGGDADFDSGEGRRFFFGGAGREPGLDPDRSLSEEEPERDKETDDGGELTPSGGGEALLGNLADPAIFDGVFGDLTEETLLQKAEFPIGPGLLIHRGEQGGAQVGVLFLNAPGKLAQVGLAAVDEGEPDEGGHDERAGKAEDSPPGPPSGDGGEGCETRKTGHSGEENGDDEVPATQMHLRGDDGSETGAEQFLNHGRPEFKFKVPSSKFQV